MRKIDVLDRMGIPRKELAVILKECGITGLSYQNLNKLITDSTKDMSPDNYKRLFSGMRDSKSQVTANLVMVVNDTYRVLNEIVARLRGDESPVETVLVGETAGDFINNAFEIPVDDTGKPEKSFEEELNDYGDFIATLLPDEAATAPKGTASTSGLDDLDSLFDNIGEDVKQPEEKDAESIALEKLLNGEFVGRVETKSTISIDSSKAGRYISSEEALERLKKKAVEEEEKTKPELDELFQDVEATGNSGIFDDDGGKNFEDYPGHEDVSDDILDLFNSIGTDDSKPSNPASSDSFDNDLNSRINDEFDVENSKF